MLIAHYGLHRQDQDDEFGDCYDNLEILFWTVRLLVANGPTDDIRDRLLRLQKHIKSTSDEASKRWLLPYINDVLAELGRTYTLNRPE